MTRIFLILLMMAALPAFAHDYKAGKLKIEHPNALATSKDRHETAGFVRISNPTKEADRLIGVAAPEVSERVEIYIVPLNEPGIAKTATDALDIPAKQETRMSLSGNHLMFFKLKRPLLPGDSFPATLTFEKAGDVNVIFDVEGIQN